MTAMDATVAAIASVQRHEGAIPHHPGGPFDPWNHIEAAMALDVGGHHREAERAYRFLTATQRADGGWIADATLDANFCAYFASGTLHHYSATGDIDLLVEHWPAVRRAVDLVLGMQRPDGTVAWARDLNGNVWPGALLTSCSCIAFSLGCAIEVAAALGEEEPDWELAAVELLDALRDRPEAFEDKDRFSMDWYYPVLSGALDEASGRARIEARWDEFVIEGRGARCVSDQPWVTAGETAELILACLACGMRAEAEALFDWIQHLRADDGAYWIGATHPDGTVWPRIKPAWGSGAVVLAYDALYGTGPASDFFRTRRLPVALRSENAPDARASR